MEVVLRDGRVPAERLELRISEKTFIACDPDYGSPAAQEGRTARCR